MNRNEYNLKLNSISRKLDVDKEVEMNIQELERLYDYKPVTMQWHELMCKALLKANQAEAVISRYLEYINKDSLIKENLEIWRTVSEAYIQIGNVREGNRYQFMLSKTENTDYAKQIENEINFAKKFDWSIVC